MEVKYANSRLVEQRRVIESSNSGELVPNVQIFEWRRIINCWYKGVET